MTNRIFAPFLRTTLSAGATVGVLDGSAAVLFAPVSPQGVFQYVAGGLLGDAAYEGGGATVALGIALHLLVATLVASVYVAAGRRLPLLAQRPVVCGLAYGAVVYFFMRHVVTPLSALPAPGFSFAGMVPQLPIHLFCVGLPIALWTWWLTPRPRPTEAR